MPTPDDSNHLAIDHGNLMDLEVVEVERESVEAAEGRHDKPVGETTEATQPKSASDQQAAELIVEEHAEDQDSVT
jgi:hypothetical protein